MNMLEKFDYELLRSVGNNDVKKLREMIDCGADINMKEYEKGTTALHIASSRGHKQCIELLVSRGADVNVQDSRGVTPLHSLVTNRYDVLALWLIRQGASMNIKDKNGFSPYDLAQGWFQKEMVQASEGKISQTEESIQEIEEQHKKEMKNIQTQQSNFNPKPLVSQPPSSLSPQIQSTTAPVTPPISGFDTLKGGFDTLKIKDLNSTLKTEVIKVYFRNDSYKSIKITSADTARDLTKKMCEKFNMPTFDKCFDLVEVVKGEMKFLAPTDYIMAVKTKWPIIVGSSGNETHLHCHFSIVIRKSAPSEAVELFSKVI
ncbi:ankyrin repeat-containing protein [Tieghemostelium lacteum]|uniref:Ankyrin repeat-containing protein n=1 Tax=Tieghemostelium lacteum TaxID=361077 RepID=A0A151Z521_TIELA|nr:ankyrin repeat-containing protein [Tieghemostelium lacteum]|eukprot:KYQ89073.1 ankyrin repeat-containing protein [Tieghemostelium lacteum]